MQARGPMPPVVALRQTMRADTIDLIRKGQLFAINLSQIVLIQPPKKTVSVLAQTNFLSQIEHYLVR